MSDGASGAILEPARDLPVWGAYDVVVAGGGIAGVAAAVAAARAGASVCLLERMCALGGLATLGNVTIWLPICDGRGRQVMGGLPEELLKLSVADLKQDWRAARFRGVPACWQPGGDAEERKRVRYRVEFNPSSYLLALEQLIVDEGVRLLYDTRVCAVRREAGRITHLIVENKSGRGAIGCRAVVDATGDADVCALAGERTESLDTNVPCGWFYTIDGGGLALHALSNKYARDCSTAGAVGPFFRGDEAEQVTAHLLESRRMIRKRLTERRAGLPESDVQLLLPPTVACLRMTRRLVGAVSLGERHRHMWMDDTVGLCGDWRQAGPVYPLPLGALRGEANRNLLAAGRCMSADTTVWDITRAIPVCAATGTAAGVAAAMAARAGGGDVHALDVRALQETLKRAGALLDQDLVREAGV